MHMLCPMVADVPRAAATEGGTCCISYMTFIAVAPRHCGVLAEHPTFSSNVCQSGSLRRLESAVIVPGILMGILSGYIRNCLLRRTMQKQGTRFA